MVLSYFTSTAVQSFPLVLVRDGPFGKVAFFLFFPKMNFIFNYLDFNLGLNSW